MSKNKVNNPLVSIVVLNWNGKHLLKPCFAALDKLMYSNLEIIVVDNGSTDGSVRFIKKNHPDYVLVENDKNYGFSGGVNAGIKVAKGDFIALLNNDAYPDPDWVEKILTAFDKDNRIGIVSPKMLKTRKEGDKYLIDSTGDFMSKWGATFPRGRDLIDKGQFDNPGEIFSACAGAATYKKEVFETIGLFDEDFFAYYEDVDISFRARLAGFKVYYEPSAIVYHQVGGSNNKRSHFTRYMSIKNMGYLYYKNMPWPLVIKYLPKFWFSQFYMLLAAIPAGALWEAIKANLELLIKLPKMFVKRHNIQKNRKVSSAQIEKWLSPQWPYGSKYVRWLLPKSSFIDEVKN